jgi:RNA polymerase sigma-70 factor (ECF subfamily)
MAFYQGLTQSEIAAKAGMPLGTVKTRTLLAMKKLRNALREEIRQLL